EAVNAIPTAVIKAVARRGCTEDVVGDRLRNLSVMPLAQIVTGFRVYERGAPERPPHRVRNAPFIRRSNLTTNSSDTHATLTVGERSYEIFSLDVLQAKYDIARLPFSLKILLENLLRNEDGESVRAEDIEALATWNATEEPSKEIAFAPARVI